jgi:hypothetical protein
MPCHLSENNFSLDTDVKDVEVQRRNPEESLPVPLLHDVTMILLLLPSDDMATQE